MKIEFGSVRVEHISRILEIENQSFQVPWSRDGFRDLISNPSFTSIGIFIDGILVGYVFYYLVMDELHVMNVAVDPMHRKKGLGTTLLDKVHQEGRKYAIKVAYLEVRETNETAQKLYEKMGYQKQGRRIGYYANKEDALLMFKKLT